MSKLNSKKIWVVRDPSQHSELADIFWATTLDELPKYILGGGSWGQWKSENHTFYDNEREAKADAEKRLQSQPKYSYDRAAGTGMGPKQTKILEHKGKTYTVEFRVSKGTIHVIRITNDRGREVRSVGLRRDLNEILWHEPQRLR